MKPKKPSHNKYQRRQLTAGISLKLQQQNNVLAKVTTEIFKYFKKVCMGSNILGIIHSSHSVLDRY